jgi:hypothetical protein
MKHMRRDWIPIAVGLCGALMVPFAYWVAAFPFHRGPLMALMVLETPLVGVACFCFAKVL